MRVLIWYWGRRGAGAQYTYELVRALTENEVEVGVALAHANELAEATAGFAAWANVQAVHSVGGALTASLRPGATIGSLARRFGADVVLHPMVSPLTIGGLISLRRTPLVTVIHDPATHPGDRKFVADQAWHLALRRSNRVVAVSEGVGVKLRTMTSRPVDVVALGPLVSPPADATRQPNGPITFVGRMLPYKGLDLLAEAWAAIPRNERCQLIIAGEADQHPSVTNALSQLRAEGAEVRLGWLADRELAALVAGSRAVVLPYREASQSGLIPIAHAAGVPVIATDVGSLREQVGESGVVVSVSADALRDALISFATAPHSMSPMSPRRQPNVWENSASQMEQVLRRALSK
jgi:glycosyltransferase involved in cell wall biosynthesis